MIIRSRAMNDFETYLLFGLILWIGIAMCWLGVARLLRSKRINKKAAMKIADLRPGHTEVNGFAWPSQQAIKNNAGELCSYYEFSFAKHIYHYVGTPKWKILFTHKAGREFHLVDQTGIAAVYIDNADIHITTSFKRWQDFLYGYTDYVEPLINKNCGAEEISSNKMDYGVTEKYILLGAPCYVSGEYGASSLTKKTIEDAGVSRYIDFLSKNTKEELELNNKFDVNRDGMVSAQDLQRYFYETASEIYKKDEARGNEIVANCEGAFSSTPEYKITISDMHKQFLKREMKSRGTMILITGALILALVAVLTCLA